MKISSTNLYSLTVIDTEPKFREKVHLPPPVTCQVSHVKCHVLHFFFFIKWLSHLVEGLLSTGPTPLSFFSIIGFSSWFLIFQILSNIFQLFSVSFWMHFYHKHLVRKLSKQVKDLNAILYHLLLDFTLP